MIIAATTAALPPRCQSQREKNAIRRGDKNEKSPTNSLISMENTLVDSEKPLSKSNVAPTWTPVNKTLASSYILVAETTKPLTSHEETNCAAHKPRKAQLKPLVSCLKPSGTTSTRRRPKERRVRGLWNPSCCCLFSHLHDDLMLFIMSHLTMMELLTASRVCRRWRYCALHESSWNRVDATDFVQEMYDKNVSNEQDPRLSTSQALNWCLNDRTVRSLTIRSIEHRLSADAFLPSISGMVELTLTGYAELSDTHVQVLLASAYKNSLHKLCLEQCPLLTDATVQSISRHCTSLEELSIHGNVSITNLNALASQWKVQSSSQSSLQSLFDPNLTSQSNTTPGGRLRRIKVSRTGVTAESMLSSLGAARGCVHLEWLHMDGDSWNDLHMKQFARLVNLESLGRLELPCANRFTGSCGVTDAGLRVLSSNGLTGLTRINLAGHRAISASGIAQLLIRAPALVDMDLEGCKGLVSSSSSDPASFHALTSSFSKSNMKRLVLSRCFQSRRESLGNPTVEEILGRVLLRSLWNCPLQELDLRGCYFATQDDVDMLRDHCPNLGAVRVSGTRCGSRAKAV